LAHCPAAVNDDMPCPCGGPVRKMKPADVVVSVASPGLSEGIGAPTGAPGVNSWAILDRASGADLAPSPAKARQQRGSRQHPHDFPPRRDRNAGVGAGIGSGVGDPVASGGIEAPTAWQSPGNPAGSRPRQGPTGRSPGRRRRPGSAGLPAFFPRAPAGCDRNVGSRRSRGTNAVPVAARSYWDSPWSPPTEVPVGSWRTLGEINRGAAAYPTLLRRVGLCPFGPLGLVRRRRPQTR
jgi:hypothetical protein